MSRAERERGESFRLPVCSLERQSDAAPIDRICRRQKGITGTTETRTDITKEKKSWCIENLFKAAQRATIRVIEIHVRNPGFFHLAKITEGDRSRGNKNEEFMERWAIGVCGPGSSATQLAANNRISVLHHHRIIAEKRRKGNRR